MLYVCISVESGESAMCDRLPVIALAECITCGSVLPTLFDHLVCSLHVLLLPAGSSSLPACPLCLSVAPIVRVLLDFLHFLIGERYEVSNRLTMNVDLANLEE